MTSVTATGYITTKSEEVVQVSPLATTKASYTATATLTANQFQGVADNAGAAGAVTLTLPALTTSVRGKAATFVRVATQSFAITGPAAGTLVYKGTAYQTVTLGTDQHSVSIYSDGTLYYVTDFGATATMS